MPVGPFRHLVTVGWGDCDPARIAYTATIPAWGLSAIEAWFKRCMGVGFYELNLDHGVGTPFVRLDVDIQAPVTPRSQLECLVYVSQIGRSSLAMFVEGRQNGSLCFNGRFVCSFIDAARRQPIAILANMRASICRFADAQDRQWKDLPNGDNAKERTHE